MSLQPETLRQRNIDLYMFAVRCITAGEISHLQRIGLRREHVAHISKLSTAEVLGLADRGWELGPYLDRMAGKRVDSELCAALIEHGAPRDMLIELFGLSTRTFAAERARLGISGGRGRPSTRGLEAWAEHRAWRLWVLLADPEDPSRLRRADHWLLVALEIPQQLRTVWSVIRRWSREEQACAVFAGDRARLTSGRLLLAERELLEKHGLSGLPETAVMPVPAAYPVPARAPAAVGELSAVSL